MTCQLFNKKANERYCCDMQGTVAFQMPCVFSDSPRTTFMSTLYHRSNPSNQFRKDMKESSKYLPFYVVIDHRNFISIRIQSSFLDTLNNKENCL